MAFFESLRIITFVKESRSFQRETVGERRNGRLGWFWLVATEGKCRDELERSYCELCSGSSSASSEDEVVDYEESSSEQNETSDDYVTEEESASTSGYEKRNGRKGKKKRHRRSLYNLQRMIIVLLHRVRLQNVHQKGAKHKNLPQKR